MELGRSKRKRKEGEKRRARLLSYGKGNVWKRWRKEEEGKIGEREKERDGRCAAEVWDRGGIPPLACSRSQFQYSVMCQWSEEAVVLTLFSVAVQAGYGRALGG